MLTGQQIWHRVHIMEGSAENMAHMYVIHTVEDSCIFINTMGVMEVVHKQDNI